MAYDVAVLVGSLHRDSINLHHLRRSLVFPNVPAMQQPEVNLGHADKFFDEPGKLAN